MTHGCLEIFTRGENRKVLLHTYHTAMDTPQWIASVPGFFAKHRGAFLFERHPPKTRKKLADDFDRFVDKGQFSYAPSVAALVIAVRPNCYEPVPPEFVGDMARWSGLDAPYRLEIVNDNLWIITDPDGSKDTKIHPMTEAVNALWKMGHKKK